MLASSSYQGIAALQASGSLLPRLLCAASAAWARWHGNHAHGHHIHPGLGQDAIDALAQAPNKFQGEAKKRLKDFAKLPWEVSMSQPEAAKVLGAFLGVPNLEPNTVMRLDVDQIHEILQATTVKGDKQLEKALFSYADGVTTKFFGDEVYYRGIVEFSNVCQNDCGYCGIRKHMHDVKRYTMPVSEVVDVAKWAFENKLGNLMLQSGELRTAQRNNYIVEVVRAVREATIKMDLERRGQDPNGTIPRDADQLGLCVSLSVGELPREEYVRFYQAGARRYLLRIETSNPDLYSLLHPSDMSWHYRVECLKTLKDVGYMIGTGVMVGLPGQTLRDLAGDIVFFRDIGANMIGMGPYITEAGTPVADMWDKLYGKEDKKEHMKRMFDLTTRMNALARITLGNANISATTALQAIDPMGREIALRRGSNVLMPILTPTKYREHYQLYEGKPCITDTADECRKCLNARITMIGKKVKDSVWGDPPNFRNPATSIPIPRSSATAAAPTSTRSFSTYRSFSSHSMAAHNAAAPQPAAKQATPVAMGAPGASSLPAGPAKGSDVPRINIGVFGVMNAGKSTFMNRITRQETSIVDSKPGTTADVKTTLIELHEVGPAKLFDTAGVDEAGELGAKKLAKTLATLKECDVAVVVVDVARVQAALPRLGLEGALKWEQLLLANAAKYGAVPLLVFNLKGMVGQASEAAALVTRIHALLDPNEATLTTSLDLNATTDVATTVASFLQSGVKRSKGRPQVSSLPKACLAPNAMIFMNIPMDAETPTMRLLRPQALVQEEAIRHWATTVGYRMDLAAARSGDHARVEAERKRFLRALAPMISHDGPKVLVTDSQAMDIVHPWTLDPATGKPLVPITTFSIAMIHRQSGGRLDTFAHGIERLKSLMAGDRVLVAEACNHNRITDVCNDIGMVQIPTHIERICGKGIVLEHAFGREFPDIELDGEKGLKRFQLVIHCGGCMIDSQKMRARILDMQEAGVAYTNYGLFLSFCHSPAALERAMEPWGLQL